MPIPFVSLALLLVLSQQYSSPSDCTASNKFYDPVLLQCTTCPWNNTQRASDFSYCNCTTSYYPNPDVIGFNNNLSCISLSPSSYSSSTQVVSLYDLDGSPLSPPTITTCYNAYPDALNLKCIPCGPNMYYNGTAFGCVCSGGQYAINGQCYTSISSWNVTKTVTADVLAEQQVCLAIFRLKWDASNMA